MEIVCAELVTASGENAGRKETRAGALQPLADGDGLAKRLGGSSQEESKPGALYL